MKLAKPVKLHINYPSNLNCGNIKFDRLIKRMWNAVPDELPFKTYKGRAGVNIFPLSDIYDNVTLNIFANIDNF